MKSKQVSHSLDPSFGLRPVPPVRQRERFSSLKLEEAQGISGPWASERNRFWEVQQRFYQRLNDQDPVGGSGSPCTAVCLQGLCQAGRLWEWHQGAGWRMLEGHLDQFLILSLCLKRWLLGIHSVIIIPNREAWFSCRPSIYRNNIWSTSTCCFLHLPLLATSEILNSFWATKVQAATEPIELEVFVAIELKSQQLRSSQRKLLSYGFNQFHVFVKQKFF